jgi:thioredoxin-related protein
MKKTVVFLIFIFVFVLVKAETPMIDGAKLGVWTQDYDAALKLAKEQNKPVMLNFTGSDWCFWCKLMDRQVFSTDTFKNYAKDNLVLVSINFPRNPDLVPVKYKKRNAVLQNKFAIRGYPTFIILNSNGNEIARLRAGRNKTGESFVNELKAVLK